MVVLEPDEKDLLKVLGERLRFARKARKETQATFGGRLGITRQTYSKMEHGDPNIDVGYWIRASALLNVLPTWEKVLNEDNVSC
jgi:transcriptional regulator with XRE-family HTH domain